VKAANRDTGGYHDKIEEMTLQIDGALEDRGNGFLFRDYDTGGLWYGLARSVAFHRRQPELREAQIRRIMWETGEPFGEWMNEKYL
jgi:glycogen synthase